VPVELLAQPRHDGNGQIEVAAARRELRQVLVSRARVGEHDDVDALLRNHALEVAEAARDVLPRLVVERPDDLVATLASDFCAHQGGNSAITHDEKTPALGRAAGNDRAQRRQGNR
jgi:hypothetical protein